MINNEIGISWWKWKWKWRRVWVWPFWEEEVHPTTFWSPLLYPLLAFFLLSSCFTIIILSELQNSPWGTRRTKGGTAYPWRCPSSSSWSSPNSPSFSFSPRFLCFFRFPQFLMAGQPSDSSPLIPPAPITDPGEIDLEAGQGEQIQCRICLETDGNLLFLCFSMFC